MRTFKRNLARTAAAQQEGSVGSPEAMKFRGALAAHHPAKGIMLATSYFMREAVEYVHRAPQKTVPIRGPVRPDGVLPGAEKLSADPFSGYLFIFRTRQGTAIRLLQYDGKARSSALYFR
jgi:hypothetical protein